MDKITLTGCKSSNLNAQSNETRALQTHPSHPCSAKYLALGFLGCDGRGGEKTFHHCRTFLCNFPTLHVFSLWKCVQEGERERERERETLSLAFPRMTHRSAEKPSIHLLSHSPIPIPIFPLRKEKSHSWRRQLQNGRASILFASILPQEALSWVGGRPSPPRPPWRTGDGWDDAKGAL